MYGTRRTRSRVGHRASYLDAAAVHFAGTVLKEARAMTTVHDLKAWKAAGRRFTMHRLRFPHRADPRQRGRPHPAGRRLPRQQRPRYTDTLPVTMEEMLHHTRAVARGAERAMVVGDLPFLSYQVSVEDGVRNAGRFLKEGARRP